MKNISVRKVDEKSWKKIKSLAALKGIPIHEALNQAIEKWCEKNEMG